MESIMREGPRGDQRSFSKLWGAYSIETHMDGRILWALRWP